MMQDPNAQPTDPMQQDPSQQDPVQQDPNAQQGLSFTTEQLVDSFKENMDPKQAKEMNAFIDEGKNLLFGKDTHQQLMSSLEQSQDLGNDLGTGAFDMMNLLMKSMTQAKPGIEIDGRAVLPAGVALISLALEFLRDSGNTQVNDDTFEEATHVFSTQLMGAHDPEFKKRAEQYGGQQDPAQAAQDPAGQGMPPPAQGMPNGGGVV